MSIKKRHKRPASSRVKQNAQPQEPKTSSSSSSWSPILWDECLTQVKRWRMNVSIRFYHILVYLSWIRILLFTSLFLSGSITSFLKIYLTMFVGSYFGISILEGWSTQRCSSVRGTPGCWWSLPRPFVCLGTVCQNGVEGCWKMGFLWIRCDSFRFLCCKTHTHVTHAHKHTWRDLRGFNYI